MPKRIYVGNLPPGAAQREVSTPFSRPGAVSSVQQSTDRATGSLTALVEMNSGADEAISALNGVSLGRKPLHVKAG